MKSLTQHIKESQMITEMASELNKYKDVVKSNVQTFVSHLCLIIHSKIYDKNEIYVKHWTGGTMWILSKNI